MVIIAALQWCVSGCQTRVLTDKRPQNNQITSSPLPSPEAELSVSDLIKQWPFIEQEKRLAMLRAWTQVPNNVRYRVAQKGDFENPFMTSDYGELAGAYGLATLIVDKTVSDSKRMSLIIFIERPGNRSDLYWIYRNMDLSKYQMSRASGDILVEVHENGSRSVCEIQWVRNEHRWTCKAW